MQQINSVTKYSQFLSEDTPFSLIKEKIAKEKKILIQAPTGCGKTYTFINHAKERKGKTVFLVPNVANVKQIAEEYEIPGLYGDEVKEGIWEVSSVVVATYDKAGAFLSSNLENLLVVLDEAHNLQSQANFRSDAIQRVKKLVEKSKEAVFLSATINHLDHRLYGGVMRFEPEIPKSIIGSSKILLSGKGTNKSVALDLARKLVAENKKCLVKMNNKNSLYKFKEDLESSNITSVVLTAENKDKSDVMKKILTDQTLPDDYQVVFCTSLLDAGVNLKEVDVIIDVENGDPNSIRQLSARPRISLKEHYIVIKGDTKGRNPEERYTREKAEGVIEKRIQTANSIRDDIETWKSNLKEESQRCLRFKFSLVEDTIDEEFFVKSDSDGRLYVDVEAVRNKEFEKYYNSLQTNPELLQKELSEYGLSTVIEAYELKSAFSKGGNQGDEQTEEEREAELSKQLKTLQALKTQQFALNCYRSKDPEDHFESNKWSEKVRVPFSLFETFGMYMALGFQYRLTYEMMLKSYDVKQKRHKIRDYILAHLYANLKDEPNLFKDKAYKGFEILYKLYENGATVEEEEKALIQYSKLLGKKYTKNKLTMRGNELFILKKKSTKKDGKTVHYKESEGLHTAKSILENYKITDEKYVIEFQELLGGKVERKLVDPYVDKVVAPKAPENDVDCPFEGESKVYFQPEIKTWMEKVDGGMGNPIPSPYFPEEAGQKEEVDEANTSVDEVEVDEVKESEAA